MEFSMCNFNDICHSYQLIQWISRGRPKPQNSIYKQLGGHDWLGAMYCSTRDQPLELLRSEAVRSPYLIRQRRGEDVKSKTDTSATIDRAKKVDKRSNRVALVAF